MSDLQPQTLQVYPVQCLPGGDDEISLVDIWLTFRKHRKAFIRTFLAIAVLGLLVALLLPKKYDLKTSLEIGTSLQGDKPMPIEAPETVKAKLENSFIPLVINKLNESTEDPEKFKIDVTIPKKSALLVLKSNVKKSDADLYKALHNAIVAAIVSDHSRLLTVLKKKIQTELELARIQLAELKDPSTLNALVNKEKKDLEEAKAGLNELTDPVIFGTKLKAQENIIRGAANKLASLNDESQVLNAKLTRITSQQELVKSEIATLEKRIAESLALQRQASSGAQGASQAMSQLLIDSQIQEDRKWLAELKEQLYITLENDKADVEKELKDNKRNQELAEAKMDEAKAVLEKITSTNLLEQAKLKAMITKIESNIQKLINDQKRLIQTQEQTVSELLAKLDNFVETKAVVEPMLSPEPTSISRKILLIAGLFLGLILATMAVFISDLRQRTQAAISERTSE